MLDFMGRLRTALTGSPDTPLVLLGNFEVEEEWARDEPGLPRVAFTAGSAVVHRMDAFTLLLAGKNDHVVLKAAPDPDHLGHLEELGLDLPRVHTVSGGDPGQTVTRDALTDPALQEALRALGPDARIVPHGTSVREEELSGLTGLPLGTPPAALCKAVNSKVYSRAVAEATGLRQATGWSCGNLTELDAAFEEARFLLRVGRRVVVKDAFGVSGKGISVLDDERRLDTLRRMIDRRAARSGDDRVVLVVEEWVDKTADLNYQFTLGRDGSVHFDFVKEAITEDGVHKGHRFPARLTTLQLDAVRHAVEVLGRRLAADGYFGVVGVDAMTDPQGGLYPVVEINARHNMSTYQTRLQERFLGPGSHALARHYPVRLRTPLAFGRLRSLLGELLFTGSGSGLLVGNFATVNAAATENGTPYEGRLHGLLIGDSPRSLERTDEAITARLAALGQEDGA
ncbi:MULTISPECIES: ATP-grasp domain-containing protein [Streptomyces]|uniref:preATP grasp domain-containing protein n=1 Tax=Streptomyces TaxID=1883 RepID=UPI0010408999|nr:MULTISPECIES: ATP-grasp domain-containing protein [Streptomyces]MBT3073218.1 ATP-grasp domain-containing protein [Streptomyces sp. COG21]MBT3081621.1 ATP-grasp domain-containing protein [Streptomyces sp. COG20]MBT3085207.1 ATP-grasp domain-containing protein [Streptomyces sp. CYG21]MBT3096755.1 ATP-grasp domain-containing protein [Streptomyces sp. CBG30]MBT3105550.1 ATP-grasp domain-containing protein [Streptomyces sp. COG19]